MSYLKLNSKKRKTFNLITNYFKNSKKPNTLPNDLEYNILVTRPNHRLGNQLLITPLIQELKTQFPNSKIHLVVNGNLSHSIFCNYNYIGEVINLPKKPFSNIWSYIKQSCKLIFKKYDLAITACESSNSSKIFVKLSRSRIKIYNSGTNSYNSNKPLHIAQYPIFNLIYFLNPSENFKSYEYPKLSMKLSKEEIKKGKLIISEFFNNKKPTICIYTFATGAKCHSKDWWINLYKSLKTEFANYNILEILPIENVSQISFNSKHFYSKDLREIASVIENTSIFIGADSGIMHLAAATNTTTVGLFNLKDSRVYGPYGGLNQSINTNKNDINKIINIINSTLTKI